MELILYHGQGIFYYFLIAIFVVRFALNYYIYHKIDSALTQSEIPLWQSLVTHSENEKEELKKHRPDIIDINREKGSIGNTESFIVALTFWWPVELWDSEVARKLKKVANFLNIGFLILLVGAVFFFIYIQDINIKYYNVTQDWTKVFVN